MIIRSSNRMSALSSTSSTRRRARASPSATRLVDRFGASDVIALRVVDTFGAQRVEDALILDPLGDGLQVERAREPDDHLDDATVGVVVHEISDELTGNFHMRDR